MEDLGWLAEKLPEEMSGDVWQVVLEDIYDEHELGQDFLLYNRESVTCAPRPKRTMCPEDWADLARRAKNRWAAKCTCTMCGEDFYTGYLPGGKRMNSGITLLQGEDGMNYIDDAFLHAEEEDCAAEEYRDGDSVLCPFCCADLELMPRREMRHGRTWQVLQAEVQVIEGYAAVLYWLVRRSVDASGADGVVASPRDALVIDRDGRLRRFVHTTHRQFGERPLERWQECRTVRDPMQVRYYNYDAENNRQIGGWMYSIMPDLAGSTGEKTALDEYIARGGVWPGVYLQMWKKNKTVENLMRGGFAACVLRSIDDAVDNAVMYSAHCEAAGLGWAELGEVKPHRMVHMTRESWRTVRDEGWTLETVKVWDQYRRAYQTEDALAFCGYVRKLGMAKMIGDLLEMQRAGWDGFDIDRVVRYLEKQNLLRDGVRLLIDYRKMLHYAGMAETEETLWPRSLLEAHDRMAAYAAKHGATVMDRDFAAAAEKYRALEWTDGELRIVLPQRELELKEEGRILRHCVGTYGTEHIGGKPIFFVRKYRRPERSYYTLNIDMRGQIPKEVQLHGYGNERHGEHKQYSHKIPQKVRDFVDRWEREVLMPWFVKQKQDEQKKTDKKKEKTA